MRENKVRSEVRTQTLIWKHRHVGAGTNTASAVSLSADAGIHQNDIEALSHREAAASDVKGVVVQKASAVAASKVDEVKPSPASVFDWHLLLIGSELIIPPTLLLFALLKRVFERAPTKEKQKGDDDESVSPTTEGLGEVMKGVGEVLKGLTELIAKK